MSIASEISRLQSDSTAIANAISAKGVTVPSGSGFDDYATLIGSISSGGLPEWLKDGDTHLWIDITNSYQLTQYLRLRMIGTIDWGDGTTESISVTSMTTKNHTYASTGKYRIDLKPTSGTFYIGGDSSSYNVMGSRSNANMYRLKALYQAEVGTNIINTLSSYAFYYCIGLLRAYVPKTITTIKAGAFSTCYSIKKIEFEDSMRVTTCPLSSIFLSCYNLGELEFYPSGNGTTMTTTVRYGYSMKEVVIPSFVTAIAANTFGNLYGLAYLVCKPTSPPLVADANAFTNLPSGSVIIVPKGSKTSYEADPMWATYSAQMMEAGVVNYSLTSVSVSNKAQYVTLNGSYTTTLTPDTGKTLGTVTVTMGGTDITSTAYSAGVVTIASVTGNISITATAS